MGTQLSTPKTEKHSEDGENAKVRYGLSSMQGWRTTMEDAHAVLLDLDDSTSFFGVYDGHGGHAVAKLCAKHLHTQILKYEAMSGCDLSDAMRKAFFRMDEMIQGQQEQREVAVLGKIFSGVTSSSAGASRAAETDEQRDDCPQEEVPYSDYCGPREGSTACVALLRNSQLFVANAGDSRCIISRHGKAHDLSKDHKPDLVDEKERIKEAGGFVYAGRVNGTLALSRAIGDIEFKGIDSLPAEKQIVTCNPDIDVVEIADDADFLVIACDGIWDCMTSQQVVDFIGEQLKHESRLQVVCESVLDRCLAKSSSVSGEGRDNMTMILVQFKKSPAAASSEASNSSS